MNGLVTRNTWFHILAGLMTVGLKLANYLMCLRGFFHHLAINQWFVWFCILLCSGQRESQVATKGFWYLAGYTFEEPDIKLLQFKFCWNNWFFVFCKFTYIDCFSYIVFCLEILGMSPAIQWILRASSQWRNVFILYRNRVLQWMVTQYGYFRFTLFFTDDFYAEKMQCLGLRFYHCMDISFYPIFFRWFLCWKSAIPRIGFLLQWIAARAKHV